MSEYSFQLQIAGRQYRLKASAESNAVLEQINAELEQRLATAATQSPLASRDQLLVLTAVNLLAELKQHQQQMQGLLATIRQAD